MLANDSEFHSIFTAPPAIKLDDKNLKNNKQKEKSNTISKNVKDQKLGSILPVELFEQGRNRERYLIFKKELENKKQITGFKEARFISLDDCEKILEKTKSYYEDLYGKYITTVPRELDFLYEHNQVTPTEIYNSIKILNINLKDQHLFWLAKLFSIIPLPHYWKKNFNYNYNQETYINLEENIEIPVHPSCKYFTEQILYHKVQNIKIINNIIDLKRMKFYDKLNRPYELDMIAFINEANAETKEDKRSAYKVINLAFNEEMSKDEINEANQRNSMFDLNNNLKDKILITITRQCGLELKTNLHLLSLIEDFVKSKEKNDNWFFRGTPNGDFYWISHQLKKSSKLYPHLDELKSFVLAYKQEFERLTKNTYKFLKNDKMLKTIFTNSKEDNVRELIKKEMLRYTEWYMSTHLNKKEHESPKEMMKSSMKMSSFKDTKSISSFSKMTDSKIFNYDVGGVYDASTFASLLGLPKEELLGDDILNLILYCSFDLEINCNHKSELKIFKSSERILYKKIKERLKRQLRNVDSFERKLSSGEDDFDLKYDSDSIKSTESIHEARRKIENPRKVIMLLNNLNQVNLNDPIEKAEFLKNLVDFEEKYGKLDEEENFEEGQRSKRSKDKESNVNTDREKKTEALNPEKKTEEEAKGVVLNIEDIKREEISKEPQPNLGILEKLDDLKRNFDEFINSEKIAFETLVEDNENPKLNLENFEKDLLFLTNPGELIKTDSSKQQINTSNSGKDDLKSHHPSTSRQPDNDNLVKQGNEKQVDMKETPEKTLKNKEDTTKLQGTTKDKNSVHESSSGLHTKDKSISRIQELETKNNKESFHSKASKTSKDSKMKEEKKDSIHDNIDKKTNPKSNNESPAKQKIRKSLMSNQSQQETYKNPSKNEISSPLMKEKLTDSKESPAKKVKREKSDESENFSEEEEFFDKSLTTEMKHNKESSLSHKKISAGNKMPTLDLAGLKKSEKSAQNKKNGLSPEIEPPFTGSKLGKELFNLEVDDNEEGENFEENMMNSQEFIEGMKNSTTSKEIKPTIGSEDREGTVDQENNNVNTGTLSSSRNEFDNSRNLEDDYEMIEDDILDEDLEVLIKTSEKNEVLNAFKTEDSKKEMNSVRSKLIKKLEKKYGKKNFQKKLNRIEKNIEQAAIIEKETSKKQQDHPEVQFSQLDLLENNLFDNFYKSKEQSGPQIPKDSNDFGETFKRKLFEKLGVDPNEKNLALTEFGNKMWEIKRRLNNHMSYLKKKLFFEKLDDLFIQIVVENRLTNLKASIETEKKKLLNAFVFLKPFIFASIANNNMIFDGIKLLYVTKKNSNPSSINKIRTLLKRIKKALFYIIIDSIKGIYGKQRYNFQIIDAFPLEKVHSNMKFLGKNETNDSLLKTKNNFKIEEDHQFSDVNMRRKEDKFKSLDLDIGQKKLMNLPKTNLNFPIQNKKKSKQQTQINFYQEKMKIGGINLDKICYFYLDRLNLSDKQKENFLYYLSHISDPFVFDHSHLDKLPTVDEFLTPHHVYKMSRRIGINLIDNNEIDLVWIPYIMLLYPLPEDSSLRKQFPEKNQDYYELICGLPINEHPGDIYFGKVLELQRRKRTAFMNNHSGGQKFQVAMSWLKFQQKRSYFYNFYYDKSENHIPKLYEEYIKFIRKMFKKKLNDQIRYQKETFTITSILELDRFTSL